MAEKELDDWNPTSSQFDPFLYMKPHSENADKKGVSEGQLIIDNLQLADSLKKKQEYFNKCGASVEVTHFNNWGNTQTALLLHAKPTQRNEICRLVKAASKYNAANPKLEPIKVGAGGAYHSWSPMFPDTGGLLINTCNLKLDHDKDPPSDRIQLDDNKKHVTVSSGVTTGELMKFFLQNDVCFESDVILPTVTYGGVLSGGCHGTGKDQTSMSDWIVSLKFVDGKGVIRTISKSSSRRCDELKAAQVNLGLFGIVVEYTLEVKEMSTCRVENTFENRLLDVVDAPGLWGQSTEKLATLLKRHWSVELFWFPFTGIMDWLLESLPSPESETKNINITNFPSFGTKSQAAAGDFTGYASLYTDTTSPSSAFKDEGEITKEEVEQEIVSTTETSSPISAEGSTEMAHIVSQIFAKIEVVSSTENTTKFTLREDVEVNVGIDPERFQQNYALLKTNFLSGWPWTNDRFWNWILGLISNYLAKNPTSLPPSFLPKLIGSLWLPYLDKVWIRAIDIDRESKWTPSREPGVPLWAKALDLAVHTGGNNILAPFLRQYPDATPLTLGLGFQALKFQYGKLQGKEVVKTPWAVHYRDGIDLMPCTDMEFAFPIDINNPVNAVKAINAVASITKRYAMQGLFSKDTSVIRFPLTLCLEMRVIKKGDSLLCPASIGKEEHVAYIEVLSTSDTPGYQEYFKEIAKEWMALGGIPHWQKQWAFLEDEDVKIFEYIKSKYGPNLQKFEAVRAKYDSNGLFMNKTMKKLFGGP